MSRAWAPIRTRADFEARVTLGVTYEDQTLEFKGGFEAYDEGDGPRELALDISQFANADGGSILVGVVEKKVDGRDVAQRTRAMSGFDERERRIRQAVRDWLVPSTFHVEIVEIPAAGGPIVAINVPPCERLVSLWERPNTIRAAVRRGPNKHYLNPDEYEAHLMNGSRAKKIAFDRVLATVGVAENAQLHLGQPVIVRDESERGTKERYHDVRAFLLEIGEYEFKINLQFTRDVVIVVPYGLVREVWPHANTIGLLLERRLVFHRDRIVFD